MSPVGFEPKISAGERPQTHALDRAATGTGENRSTRGKSHLNVTLSTMNNTSTGLGLNPGLRGGYRNKTDKGKYVGFTTENRYLSNADFVS
jgi:hypothetical protein